MLGSEGSILATWQFSQTQPVYLKTLFKKEIFVEIKATLKFLCVCVCSQQCWTLCGPMGYNPPGSSVCGISQARILEWVAISFSRGSSQLRDQTCISCISCIGRWILYHKHHLGSPQIFADMPNYPKQLYKKKESCSTYSPLQDSTLDDNQDSTVLLKGLTDEAEPIAHKQVHVHSQTVFDKKAKAIQWKKESPFNK